MAKTNGTETGTAFSRMMSEWPAFAFNYEAMLDGQRRNWAALVEANRVWNESAQAFTTRQMEFARQAMQDFAALFEEAMRKPGAFEDQISRGAECTRHTLEGLCDLADHATKSGAEVMKLFNKRMGETLEDARSYTRRAPQASGSTARAAAAD